MLDIGRKRQYQPCDALACDVLERGEIFFLCPPTRDGTAIDQQDDVICFFLLMHQESAENHRLLHVGKKKGQGGVEHYWGIVYEIVDTTRHWDDILGDRDYASARRCARDMMMMRPSGMGEYQVQRQGDCTYLSYTLLPQANKRALPDAMQIPAAANYLIRAKNPDASTSPASLPSAQGDNQADARTAALRRNMEKHFSGRPFISVDPSHLLDHEGLEILFLGMDTCMHAPPALPDSHDLCEPNGMPNSPEILDPLAVDLAAQCAAAEQDADTVFAALRMPPPVAASVQNASSLRARWH